MLDLENIRRTWLVPCGSCDYGLNEFGCTCPPGDIRSVVQTLVDELEKLYDNASILSASTLDEALEEKAWNEGFEAAGERLVDVTKRLTTLEKLCAEAAYDELLSRDWMGRWRQYKALPMAGGLDGDKTALRCLCTWSQHQEGLSSVYTLEAVNRRCPAHGDKPRQVKDEEVSEVILEKINPSDLESIRMIGSMKAGPELFAPWEDES